LPSSNSPVGVSGWSNVTTPTLAIGTLPNVGYDWQGDLQEILVYDHQLTPAELQQVGTYLANKYALPYPQLPSPTFSRVPGLHRFGQCHDRG
jgi:hypothetical protein